MDSILGPNLDSLKDIQHCFYINLISRTDRRAHVENELKKIEMPAQRFEAIRLQNGALGCSMSHLRCLEIAKNNNWDHILIIEDDIKFMNPSLFKEQFTSFLSNHKEWDVVLIAGNNISPYTIVDHSCVKVTKCQTTTGYLVKSHYYDKLITNIRNGINMLIREPNNHIQYAIDKHWFKLQEKDNWYLITPLTVTQQEGYSDIEKKVTNYTSVMIDLDKKWLKKRETSDSNSNSNSNSRQIVQSNFLKINKPSATLNNFFL